MMKLTGGSCFPSLNQDVPDIGQGTRISTMGQTSETKASDVRHLSTGCLSQQPALSAQFWSPEPLQMVWLSHLPNGSNDNHFP